MRLLIWHCPCASQWCSYVLCTFVTPQKVSIELEKMQKVTTKIIRRLQHLPSNERLQHFVFKSCSKVTIKSFSGTIWKRRQEGAGSSGNQVCMVRPERVSLRVFRTHEEAKFPGLWLLLMCLHAMQLFLLIHWTSGGQVRRIPLSSSIPSRIAPQMCDC